MPSERGVQARRPLAEAPVSIVYSDNQANESSASMNGGDPESKVIQDFKAAKNGLMIVVDKLQTGFDEPKLHTLFLDKEIQDVNAIQTISRVNRTCKYKEECHIVDLSWRNVNVENIREAFKKYCGITVSDFNPEREEQLVKMLFGQLCKSEPFRRWFQQYRRQKDDTAFTLRMEDDIRRWIQTQFERTANAPEIPETDSEFMQLVNEAKELRKTVGEYGASIKSLEGVLDIEPKYTDADFLRFWEVYCRIYRAVLQGSGGGGDETLHPGVDTEDEIPGITIADEVEIETDDDEEDEDDDGDKTEPCAKDRCKKDILAIIQAWNEREQLSQEEVRKWMAEVGKMFAWLLGQDRFMAVIRDDTFLPDTKLTEYSKVLKVYKFLLSRRDDLDKANLFKQMLDDNGGQFLDTFMRSLPDYDDGQLEFDFGQESSSQGTDDTEMTMPAHRFRPMGGEERKVPTYNDLYATDLDHREAAEPTSSSIHTGGTFAP